MLPGSENIILIYRIHYKAMNTVVPNLREDTTKLITPKGTTTFFVTDLQKGNLVVPRSIEWEQVKLPDNWILEEAIPPKKEESEDVESIIETNNGTVAISFARTRSRNSFSGRTVVSEPIIPRTSLSGIDLDRFRSIGIHRTEEQVAKPIYGPESTVSSPIETVSLKRPESPTPSDMGYDIESVRTQQPKRIMALTKEESPFEKWFQITFSLEKQQAYLKEYARYKEKEGIKSFPEFVRFILTCKKQSYPDFENQQFLVTLESAYRNYVTPKAKTLRGVHPPLTEISYKISDNQEYECSPFSRSDKQGNYANLSLYTIGQQLSRVETQLQTFKSREYKPEKGETSNKPQKKGFYLNQWKLNNHLLN
ncbi:hypothetical protein GH714_006508 [Hevea brasiliensis]|uniref:Uncharacterized protein n=1 Tax=Hevea brasiliensis TaxID=3981 RepID=A0A6A6L762_HEVBR|nr:hypothetical protein GH714_006508 [Hevea brasiliensis]